MAVQKTSEVLGSKPIPDVYETGDVKEVVIKWDASAANLASGDFLQLIRIPANAVISDVRVASSATTGTATVAVGIANAEATTSLSTTFVTGAAITTTAIAGSVNAVLADTPAADNSRILAAQIGTANITTPTLYFAIQYRAARYGL